MAETGETPWTDQERQIEREIMAGLPNQQDRLAENLRALDYYYLRGGMHVPLRPGESTYSWRGRAKQTYPLTYRAVDVKCSRLYSPGPAREIKDDPDADGVLQEIYRDNMIDALMHQADVMATLLGVAAVQATPGRFDSLKSIKLYLWDYSQLVIYPDPEDVTRAAYVVTIDRQDEQTRYTWWSDRYFRTYLTDKLSPGQTAAGRTAKYDASRSGVHGYGRLPFGLVYNDLPTNGLVPEGLGRFLADQNAAIDLKRDRMDAAVVAYHTPKGWVSNVPPGWQPDDTIGEYMRLVGVANEAGVTDPKIGFLQAELDIESGLMDIEKGIDLILEGIGVPQTLYRMNQASLPSGESQKAEQKPLIDYTEKRQELFKRWETDVAEATLAVAGVAFGSDAASEAGTRGLNLSCRWAPEAPTLEEIQADEASLQDESKSLVMVVQERFRYTSRKEAIEHLRRVADDNAELKGMGLGPEAAAARRIEQQKQLMAAEDPADPANPEPPGGPSHGQ